jgi:penicillin-binding protein 2
VAALLESGAWGASAAGPIVRKILDAWLASHGGVIAGSQRLPPSTAPAGSGPQLPATDTDGAVEDLPAQASTGATP